MSKTTRKRRGNSARKRVKPMKGSRAKKRAVPRKGTKTNAAPEGRAAWLKPFRFKVGGKTPNPDGRPRTGRRVLHDDFIADLQAAWKTSGKGVIERAIERYPDVFLYANAAIVPKELRQRIKHLIDKDTVLGTRLLAACADFKPLRLTVGAEAAQEENELRKPEWNSLASYRPYPKQIDFHNAGAEHDERLLMAGNQLGKTLAGAMEWAMHLTGRYPDWWKGKVFESPVRLWASGVTKESTRDNPQRVLIGLPQRKETWGSGTIPKDALNDCTPGYHVADALDSVVVRWGGGGDVQMGESVLAFKSYEKGREKWQGETLDGVWFDEEPPLDIYCEGRTRTIAKRGIVIVTFTPLQGMSEVVKLFLGEADVLRMKAA